MNDNDDDEEQFENYTERASATLAYRLMEYLEFLGVITDEHVNYLRFPPIELIEDAERDMKMTEYGRIHTDGSRSGGRPIPSKDCPKCERFGDDCGEHSPSWQELAAYWKAEAERLRQPTQSDAVRDLVATLWCASGCSCCRDDDAWEKASHELAELLGIPKYDDGSGHDWYSVCDAAKGQSK